MSETIEFFFFLSFFSIPIYPVTKPIRATNLADSGGTLIRENHCAVSFGRVNCVKIYVRMWRGNRSVDSRKEEWKDRDKVFYCILPLYVWCYCLVWLFVKVREVNP